MRRRHFIVALPAAVACLQRVGAEQVPTVPRIGYLGAASLGQSQRVLDAFHRRLSELGHIKGRSLEIEYRFANGEHDRLPKLAAELVELKVDLLVAAPTQAVLAAKDATSTIPIVMVAGPDPVPLGWAHSLSHPSENLTGVTFTVGPETFAKELELLQEVAPEVRLVAVLFDSSASPSQPLVIKSIEAASKSLGLQLQILEARHPSEVESAFTRMGKQGAGSVLVIADSNYARQASRIAELAIANRLPSIYQIRFPVEAGGLMSYGPNAAHQWARAAEYVDRLLRGAKVGDLPVQQPTKFDLVINLKTAAALGLTIPPTLLARADEVIE